MLTQLLWKVTQSFEKDLVGIFKYFWLPYRDVYAVQLAN